MSSTGRAGKLLLSICNWTPDCNAALPVVADFFARTRR